MGTRSDYSYSYYQSGQQQTETRTTSAGNATTSYVYDSLGRLEQATLPDGSSRRYCFDLDSNRTQITANANTACGTATYTYDPAKTSGLDELTSVSQTSPTVNYSYNSDGDTTRRGPDGLNWDGWDRLTGGGFGNYDIKYSFDPLGRVRERTAGESYRSIILADTPQHYYRLDETSGTTLNDSSSTPTNGSYNTTGVSYGTSGATGDDKNTAASFDGSTGYASASGFATNSTFTIEAWVKASAAQNDRGIAGKWRSAGEASPGGAMLWLDSSGHYTLVLTNAPSNYLTTTSSPTLGGWDYLVGTFDGTALRLYLNGVLIGKKSYTGSFGAPTNPFEIGRYAGVNTTAFNGAIDDVALYNYPLSQQQVAIHYSAAQPLITGSGYKQQILQDNPNGYWRLGESSGTTATDSSTAAHNGSYSTTGVTLNQTGTLPADPDTAASFSGASSYASIPAASNFSGAFTIEAWIKSSAIQSDKGIAGKWRSAGEASPGGAMLWINQSGNYALVVTNTAGNYLNSTSNPVPGSWEYIVGSYDGSTLRLYQNGLLIASKAFTGSLGSPTIPFEIGRYAGANTTNFNGTIDEVATYPAALSSTRILAHYKKGRDLRDTRYIYANSASSIFETNITGAITLASAPGPTGDLAHYNGPPATSSVATYEYYDAHGNLAAEADTTGTRTTAAPYTYDPFGAANDTTPTNTTTKRWTGSYDKKLDTASNLIQMGARPYDPTLGRFLTTDPIEGGSLNTYDYAAQDPVDGYDLAGQMATGLSGAEQRARVSAHQLVWAYENQTDPSAIGLTGTVAAIGPQLLDASVLVVCIYSRGALCSSLAASAAGVAITKSAVDNGIVGSKKANWNAFTVDVMIVAATYGAGRGTDAVLNPFYVRDAADRRVMGALAYPTIWLGQMILVQAASGL